MAQKEMYRAVVNSPSTTLTVAINSMDTTIPVIDISVFATAPGIATIYDDNYTETIKYTGVDTTNKTLTGVTRGFDGVARDWALGKTIARLLTAYDVNTFKENIEDLNTNTFKTSDYPSMNCIKSGIVPSAIGDSNAAITDYAYAEGKYNLACNGTLYKITAYDNTAKTIALNDDFSLAVGDLLQIKVTNSISIINVPITVINGLVVTLNTTETITSNWKYAIKKNIPLYSTHAEGNNTTSSGVNSHAEGDSTLASGVISHAEGNNTTSSGYYSHAEGNSTTASGDCDHAEGSGTKASGGASHAEGYITTAIGYCSHAEGRNNLASGDYSHVEGKYATAEIYCSHVMGTYNKALTGSGFGYVGTADAFVIGNGTGSSTLGNAFRVTFDGKTYGLSAFNSTGADYAEYFEWLDGNLNNEDRVGYFVTLDGEKIRKTISTDTYILGVVSAMPSVAGDSYQDDWNQKYLTDNWGRIQYHEVVILATEDIPEHTDLVPTLNPDWDSTQEYIPREQRPEWGAVGIMGKLLIRDDGSCQVNGYCTSNDDGVATSSTTGYRVMKRVSESIIQILIK